MEQKFQQQFVNFSFYKLDPIFRRLDSHRKEAGKQEFVSVVREYQEKLTVRSYSTVGLRADADLLLWKIADDLDLLQEMQARLLGTELGRYLNQTYSYLSVTRRSMYVERHQHPGSEGTRVRIVPSGAKYIFVYPFVKTREWYQLSKHARQGMMDEHIEVGHRYPSVKLNTTYSFGLDDQEFVVAFETDSPTDFVDLVMELRGTEASRYTLRDTPIFTCISQPIERALDLMVGLDGANK